MTDRDASTMQFVDAGVTSLVDAPRDILERGLRSEQVVNQAGASQATFFRKFRTKSEFIEAVITSLTESTLHSADKVKQTVRAQLAANNDALRPTVTTLVKEAFDAIVNDASTARSLLSHIFAGSHRRTSTALENEYRRRDELVSAAYEALFEKTDATLRRPFTTKTFAVTVNAVIDGFRIRSRIDSRSVSPDIMSDALLAILGAVVDTSGLHQHLDDVVGPIDQPAEPRPLPRDPRAAFLAAARSEFGKRGYFMTQINDIADTAAVPRVAANKLFPTKPHILVAALQSRVDSLRETVADDILIGLGDVAIIENFLLRCAQLASDETEFMDALLVAVAHDTYGEPESLLSLKEKLNIPSIIAPIVQRGQDNGAMSTISAPMDIAAGITNTLLLRCFTRRSDSPADNAAFVGAMVLNGLAHP